MSGKRLLVGALVIVVMLVVMRGIMIIGSPGEERTRRLDSRRVSDLQRLSQLVEAYHARYQQLPPALAGPEVARALGVVEVARDPVTTQPYEYRTISATSYELCGTFDRATEDGGVEAFWLHGAGRQCFTLNIKKTSPE